MNNIYKRNRFRKVKALFACLIMICVTIVAQNSKIDSLERVLASFDEDSYEKGRTLLRLSAEYHSVNRDTAQSRASFMEAIDMGRRSRLGKLEAEAYSRAALFYWRTGEHHISYRYYKKAEMAAIKSDDKAHLCHIYVNLTTICHYYSDFDNIIYYSNKALETGSEWYDPETLEPKDISPDVLEKVNEDRDIKSLMFIAKYLVELDPFNRNNTIESQESLEFHQNMFQKAIELNIESSRILLLATHSGFINLALDRPQEALYYLNYIIYDYENDFSPNFEKRRIATMVYGLLAQAYAMLKQWDLTEYYMGKITESPLRPVPINARLGYLRARSMFESYRGDHTNALETFKLYHHISDSARKAAKTDEIARIIMWHEFEQREAENQILQMEKVKNQLKIIAFTALILMFIVLFAIALYWYYKPVR